MFDELRATISCTLHAICIPPSVHRGTHIFDHTTPQAHSTRACPPAGFPPLGYGPIHVRPGEPSQVLVTAAGQAGALQQQPAEPSIVVQDDMAEHSLHAFEVRVADARNNLCSAGPARVLQLVLQYSDSDGSAASGGGMAAAAAAGGGGDALLQEVPVQQVTCEPGSVAAFDGASLPELAALLDVADGQVAGSYRLVLRDASEGVTDTLPDFTVGAAWVLPGRLTLLLSPCSRPLVAARASVIST